MVAVVIEGMEEEEEEEEEDEHCEDTCTGATTLFSVGSSDVVAGLLVDIRGE